MTADIACPFSHRDAASEQCSTEVVPHPLGPETTTTTAPPETLTAALPVTGADLLTTLLVGLGLVISGLFLRRAA